MLYAFSHSVAGKHIDNLSDWHSEFYSCYWEKEALKKVLILIEIMKIKNVSMSIE